MGQLDDIIAYENGELDAAGTLELFAGLIKTGRVFTLQGSYGRTAATFIKAGFITEAGEITDYGRSQW